MMVIKDSVVKQAHEIYLGICRYQKKPKPSCEILNVSFRLQHLGTAMLLTKFQNKVGQTEKGGAWVWGVCLMLMLATMLNYMDRILLNQAAQQIKIDLDFSSYIWINGYGGSNPTDFNYGLLEGFFGISFALGALFFGYFSDKIPIVWLYPVGVLAWSAAGFSSSLATDYPQLLASRCLLGFFEASNWPCGLVTTRRLLAARQRGLGNGILQSGGALGAVATPLLILGLSLPISAWMEHKTNLFAFLGETDLYPQWRLAFQLVASLGFFWAIAWLAITLPEKKRWEIKSSNPDEHQENTGHFLASFVCGRKFWILLAMVVSLNITWHFFRVWTPIYLQEIHQFNLVHLSLFSSAYFLLADAGAIGAGLLVLWLSEKTSPAAARSLVFFLGSLGCLSSLLVGSLNGVVLCICLWFLAICSMSLFPTYYAQSQEISAKHQGKVTGLLGCCCWIALFITQSSTGAWLGYQKEKLEANHLAAGLDNRTSKKLAAATAYSQIISLAGIPPMLAAMCLFFWPKISSPITQGPFEKTGTGRGTL